jgi:hypothetical protein
LQSDISAQAKTDDAFSPARIRDVPGRMAGTVDQAEAALIGARSDVFQRSAFVVRLENAKVPISGGRNVIARRIAEIGDYALLEELSSVAKWIKLDRRTGREVEIDPPIKVVKALRERVGRWRLPVLAGVINAPTLRADGSLLSKPGYDEKTGLLFDESRAVFPAIREHPSRHHAVEALGILNDLISTFPFVADLDRAVALSAVSSLAGELARRGARRWPEFEPRRPDYRKQPRLRPVVALHISSASEPT